MRVLAGRNCGPSARALQRALDATSASGSVRFGFGINKREALRTMARAGVPVPKQYGMEPTSFPCVGRPDRHFQGRGFWLCYDQSEVRRAKAGTRHKRAATHFMEFIESDKEFRVHVVDGMSIKISEKILIDEQGRNVPQYRRNHAFGYICRYPYDFNHKKTLRKIAKEAVEALGLELGAVDILWSEERGFFVTEVNSAPCLTDSKSDTLRKYVEAITRRNDDAVDDSPPTNPNHDTVRRADTQKPVVYPGAWPTDLRFLVEDY